MILVSLFLSLMGFVCLLSKRTLIGMLIGVQLLVFGSSSAFVMSGVISKESLGNDAHVFGIFIALLGLSQLTIGFAFVIRLLFLKDNIEIDSLRMLRH